MNSDHTSEPPPIASDSDLELKPLIDGDAATTTPPNPAHANTSTSDTAETLERGMAPDSPPRLGPVADAAADADACHKLEHVDENAAARPVAAEPPFDPSPPSVSVRRSHSPFN